jgi:NADH-quinone oxidoreductase subunit A
MRDYVLTIIGTSVEIRRSGLTVSLGRNRPMTQLLFLAQMADPRMTWAPIVILLLIGVAFAVGSLVLSTHVGPSRTGKVKEISYESGMMPVGDARQRFNIRFYQVAITFLVFDVEIIFLYPWATVYPHVINYDRPFSGVLMLGMLLFLTLIMLGYFYEWGKGVFRWD